MDNIIYSRAYGTLWGACIGDAAGAPLEFLKKELTEELVQNALDMKGGGIWGAAPGQITDDGELMLSLATALALMSKQKFDVESVAQFYTRWYLSQPFDIGTTTENAFGPLGHTIVYQQAKQNGFASIILEAALNNNTMSQANGSLMRCMPLAVWAYNIENPDIIAEVARMDSRLSHPHPNCQDSVACYVLALVHLIRYGDPHQAFQFAESWANQAATPDVCEWLEQAKAGDLPDATQQQGWVRVAFTNAFYHLWKGSSFEEALKETLEAKGDTDTNACIVGGMMGALYGFESLPQHMVSAVLYCDTYQGSHPRPDFLHPNILHPLFMDLVS